MITGKADGDGNDAANARGRDRSDDDRDGCPGAPTLPAQLSFSGSPAIGSTALLSANPAQYSSPGSYSAYDWLSLTNVPTDLTAGSDTSKMTITAQGNDEQTTGTGSGRLMALPAEPR